MKKTKLGLPLEYQKQPEYFDTFNIQDDTHSKNSILEKILKKYHVKTVLDLTCGTGSQVFFLAQHGYKITGADFSPALLEIARQTAHEQKLNLTFLDGDMRTLKVGNFDAVITMFNAIGHLTKAGFEKTIKNVLRNLNPGGVYIFDIFNLSAMTDATVVNLAMYVQKKLDDSIIRLVQCSTIDRKTGLLTSYDNYTIQKNADKPVQLNNKFSLQLYTTEELKKMLTKQGFEILEQCDMNGSQFLENHSISILTVARKK